MSYIIIITIYYCSIQYYYNGNFTGRTVRPVARDGEWLGHQAHAARRAPRPRPQEHRSLTNATGPCHYPISIDVIKSTTTPQNTTVILWRHHVDRLDNVIMFNVIVNLKLDDHYHFSVAVVVLKEFSIYFRRDYARPLVASSSPSFCSSVRIDVSQKRWPRTALLARATVT